MTLLDPALSLLTSFETEVIIANFSVDVYESITMVLALCFSSGFPEETKLLIKNYKILDFSLN